MMDVTDRRDLCSISCLRFVPHLHQHFLHHHLNIIILFFYYLSNIIILIIAVAIDRSVSVRSTLVCLDCFKASPPNADLSECARVQCRCALQYAKYGSWIQSNWDFLQAEHWTTQTLWGRGWATGYPGFSNSWLGYYPPCTSLVQSRAVSTSFWKLCCHSARLPLPQYRSYWRCSKCGHSHWHSGQIETSSTKAPLSTEQLLLFWFWEWLKHFKWKGWSFSTTRLLAWKCLFVCRDKKWMFGKMT